MTSHRTLVAARNALYLTAILRDTFDVAGDIKNLTSAIKANAALLDLVERLEGEEEG